ncbi:hypothetical protein DXG01_001541, partial [Tephrocybe rancida]
PLTFGTVNPRDLFLTDVAMDPTPPLTRSSTPVVRDIELPVERLRLNTPASVIEITASEFGEAMSTVTATLDTVSEGDLADAEGDDDNGRDDMSFADESASRRA